MYADHRQPKLLPTTDYQMMQTVIKARYTYVSMKMSCILLDGLHDQLGSLVAVCRWTPRLPQHKQQLQVKLALHNMKQTRMQWLGVKGHMTTCSRLTHLSLQECSASWKSSESKCPALTACPFCGNCIYFF